ncbi:MAG: hypothetical protein Q8M76_17800, partial [Spirochaetaceae bacterium]|nr:hypothetical protein [Spirochaetaceae bacterium]
MKRFLLITVLAAAALSLGTAQAAKNVKLKMIIWDLNNTTYMQPIVDAYVAQHPNVSFEFINIPANDYGQKLAIMLAGG